MRGRLSYANVMATVAVFVALGGTGYAISKLPKDSVKSKQIAKNAVKSPEVKNGSLLFADFAEGVLTTGEQGPPGEDGEPGPPGPTFGVVDTESVPPANADISLVALPLTTPAAGKLFAMFSANPNSSGTPGLKVDCSAGNPTVGLYVDGTPVPGTSVLLQDNIFSDVDTFGVTSATLPAGAHQLTLDADCANPGATVNNGSVSGNKSIGGILLGG